MRRSRPGIPESSAALTGARAAGTGQAATAQQGLSLVELLIAMTLGLILISGVIVVFVGSKRSSDIASAMSDMQENGRFALNAIASDVRMAGYQGCLDFNASKVTVIARHPPTSDLRETAISGSIVQANSSWLPALSFGTGKSSFTAPTVNKAIPGTHTLALQFGEGSAQKVDPPMTSATDPVTVKNDMGLQNGDLALISNCEGGEVFRVSGVSTNSGTTSILHDAARNSRGNFDVAYGTESTSALTYVMPFVTHVYYVGDTGRTNGAGDNTRALYLQSMPFDSTNPPIELVEGVEDMRISYGIGDTGGRVKYVDASGINGDNDLIQSVRIGLLMASWDQVSDQNDTRSYLIAGHTIASTTGADTASTYVSNRQLRMAFNTTAKVRNRRASN